MSKKFIVDQLNISRSTLYRELKRNSSSRGTYNASRAQMLANERKERYGRSRKFTASVKTKITKWLTDEQWSPKQIVGHCLKHHIAMVSHERIYQFIRTDKASGGTLYKELRHKLKHRKRPVGGHMPVKDRIPISERPEVINNKLRFGDWEIDTIIGKDHKGAIVTIVERQTAFFMMGKLEQGKDAKALAKKLIQMLLPYKRAVLSITSDNGGEFAEHKTISKKLDTSFYFANPYASWERGLNEYTNKLIRQYIPKGTDFNTLTNKQILDIQHKINRRPREKLNFETPKNLFYKLVA
jgi:IS30 family transposase